MIRTEELLQALQAVRDGDFGECRLAVAIGKQIGSGKIKVKPIIKFKASN